MGHKSNICCLMAGVLALALLTLASPAGAVPAVEPEPDPTENRTLVVRAKGDTGEELMVIKHGDETLGAFFVGTTWNLYPTDLTVEPGADPLELGDLRVSFVNDKFAPPIDRNLRVDWVEVDGDRYESEAADTFSTGAWTAEEACRPGKKRRQVLHCNGYFQYAQNSVSLEVHAKGATGAEIMEIQVGPDQRVVGSVTVGDTFGRYDFDLPADTPLADVRVAFINDHRDSEGDRNLRVKSIVFDGREYSTKSPDTLSVGSSRGCGGGKVAKATLWCNGYFQFTTPDGDFELDGQPTMRMTNTEYTITWSTTLPGRYDVMSLYNNGQFNRGQTFSYFVYENTHVITGDRTTGAETSLAFEITPVSQNDEALDSFRFRVNGTTSR